MQSSNVRTALQTLLLCGIAAMPAIAPHKASKPSVTADPAKAVALTKFHGKIVGTTRLENAEGTWQYGVLGKSGKTPREVMLNAKSGKIDRVEVTSAAKERTDFTQSK